MNDPAKRAYAKLRDLFLEVQTEIEKATAEVKSENLEGMCDSAYAFKKMEDMLDSMRKDIKRRRVVLERIVCMGWLARGTAETIKTDYVSVDPDIKSYVTYPKSPQDAGYDEMMADLGVDPSTISMGIVKVDFNAAKEYVTQLMADGKPLPRWAKNETVHEEYILRFHPRRKEIDAT